jgi:hypothetical protein
MVPRHGQSCSQHEFPLLNRTNPLITVSRFPNVIVLIARELQDSALPEMPLYVANRMPILQACQVVASHLYAVRMAHSTRGLITQDFDAALTLQSALKGCGGLVIHFSSDLGGTKACGNNV